jgi:hypothetical protein
VGGSLHDSEFEPWRPRTNAPSPCSAEPGFSAAASFGISGSVGFLFGLRQGTRIGVLGCLLLMIRNFNRLKQTFTTNNRSRVRLLALTVVNAVSLYVEQTFQSLHVECAQRLATQARQAGVERLVHVSGIGADAASHRSMSASAAKANWPPGPRSQMPFSSVRR